MDQSRWAAVILFLGIIVIAAFFLASPSGNSQGSLSQASLKMTVRLAIGMTTNQYSNTTRGIVFADNIGAPGGLPMATRRYWSDGVNGYYPLFTLNKQPMIHVVSTVHRNYTIGDFFEVWGEPLGPFDTLNTHANITATSNRDFWSMCLTNPFPQNTNTYRVDDWGSHVLRNNETITIVFANEACA